MKILHTADWHIGHRLHEQSQVEEQTLFLDWLTQYIDQNKIDMLFISGDVFDTGVPSNQSLEMYYDFLVKLRSTSCQSIFITGGNHDSPGMLNAPKGLLNALSINVIGKSTGNVEDEVFEIDLNGEKVVVAAVPYLRDGDIRRAVAGETFGELSEKYKTALINHYKNVAEHCRVVNTNNAPIIAMGHLFATGGSISDSEQNIYVGTLGHIGVNDFPEDFNYIALGHLHRPQIVGGNERIRYSGSPYILSFSEINYSKKLIEISLSDQNVNTINEVEIPRFREVYRVEGAMEDCIDKFPEIVSNAYGLTPWVEVVLDEENDVNTERIKAESEKYPIEILKMTLKKQRLLKGIEELLQETKSIKELLPTEVFKLKCQEMGFDLESRPEVGDAFDEILQAVKKQ